MAIMAGATLVGGLVAGNQAAGAAKSAAGAQSAAAAAGINEQQRQFNATQANLKPFQEAGVGALGQQQALLGLSGQEAQQGAFDNLVESPGQQFIRKRQQRALLQNSAAIGGLGGGNVRRALQEQAAGFAQQDINNQFNRLSSLTGGGQTAATNIGQFGQNTAGNIANLQTQAGQARASGILGASQAQQKMIGSVAKAGGQFSGGRS